MCVCAYTLVCICSYVCTYMWRSEVNAQCLTHSPVYFLNFSFFPKCQNSLKDNKIINYLNLIGCSLFALQLLAITDSFIPLLIMLTDRSYTYTSYISIEEFYKTSKKVNEATQNREVLLMETAGTSG